MPTGIQGFDELLGGGLPIGRSIRQQVRLVNNWPDDQVMTTPALRLALDDEASWFFGDLTGDEQLVAALRRAEEVRS